MNSPYDSDVSEGMKDLVDRGFAFKRDRDNICPEIGYIGETRGQVRDMDVSHVQRPLTLFGVWLQLLSLEMQSAWQYQMFNQLDLVRHIIFQF